MGWHIMDTIFYTESNQFDLVVFVDNGLGANAGQHNTTAENRTEKP